MRIQSKWRDYYDHISHLYGADDRCLYIRKELTGKASGFGYQTLEFTTEPETSLSGIHLSQLRPSCPGAIGDQHMDFIVVGFHCFPVLRIDGYPGTMRLFQAGDEYLLKTYYVDRRGRGGDRYPPTFPTRKQIAAMSRSVGAPVYRVTWVGDRVIHVAPRIPILKDIGIPSVLPPEQAWQSIYEVLTSVLRTDPDKEPPKTVSNEERIQAAGFDRNSFRHPVK